MELHKHLSFCVPWILLRMELSLWPLCNTNGGTWHMHEVSRDQFPLCCHRVLHSYIFSSAFKQIPDSSSFALTFICSVLITVLCWLEHLLPATPEEATFLHWVKWFTFVPRSLSTSPVQGVLGSAEDAIAEFSEDLMALLQRDPCKIEKFAMKFYITSSPNNCFQLLRSLPCKSVYHPKEHFLFYL